MRKRRDRDKPAPAAVPGGRSDAVVRNEHHSKISSGADSWSMCVRTAMSTGPPLGTRVVRYPRAGVAASRKCHPGRIGGRFLQGGYVVGIAESGDAKRGDAKRASETPRSNVRARPSARPRRKAGLSSSIWAAKTCRWCRQPPSGATPSSSSIAPHSRPARLRSPCSNATRERTPTPNTRPARSPASSARVSDSCPNRSASPTRPDLRERQASSASIPATHQLTPTSRPRAADRRINSNAS